MIKHAWTVVCQKSVIDKDTNNISLEVLEQINIRIPEWPDDAKGVVFPAPVEVVSLWYRSDPNHEERGQARIKLVAPNSEEVFNVTSDIDLTQHQRSRSRVRLEGLPIPRDASGLFIFIVELANESSWTEYARIPLQITLEIVK